MEKPVVRLLAVVVGAFATGFGAAVALGLLQGEDAAAEVTRLNGELTATKNSLVNLQGAAEEATRGSDEVGLFRWASQWVEQGPVTPGAGVARLDDLYRQHELFAREPMQGWVFMGQQVSFALTSTLVGKTVEQMIAELPRTASFFTKHPSLAWQSTPRAPSQPAEFVQVTILTSEELRDLLLAGIADTVGYEVFGAATEPSNFISKVAPDLIARALPRSLTDFITRDPGVTFMLGAINENITKPAVLANSTPLVAVKKDYSTMACVGVHAVVDGSGKRQDAVTHIVLRQLGGEFLLVHAHSLGPSPWVQEWLATFRIR